MPPSADQLGDLVGPRGRGLPASRGTAARTGPRSSSVDQSAASTSTCSSSPKISAAASASAGSSSAVRIRVSPPRTPERSQAVPTPQPVPNSAMRPVAGRGQGRQQAAGLVAAEGHVARAARDVEGARHDLGQLGGCAHGAESRIPGQPSRMREPPGQSRCARRGRAVRLVSSCGACSYSSIAAARPDSKATSSRSSAFPALRSRRAAPRRSRTRASFPARSAPEILKLPSVRSTTGLPAPPRGGSSPTPQHHQMTRSSSVYDMYPDWGPRRTGRRSRPPPAREHAQPRGRPGLARPAGQRRPAAGRQLACRHDL